MTSLVVVVVYVCLDHHYVDTMFCSRTGRLLCLVKTNINISANIGDAICQYDEEEYYFFPFLHFSQLFKGLRKNIP